jgi:hypothetical protein
MNDRLRPLVGRHEAPRKFVFPTNWMFPFELTLADV